MLKEITEVPRENRLFTPANKDNKVNKLVTVATNGNHLRGLFINNIDFGLNKV
jgi:hypothetical protein